MADNLHIVKCILILIILAVVAVIYKNNVSYAGYTCKDNVALTEPVALTPFPKDTETTTEPVTLKPLTNDDKWMRAIEDHPFEMELVGCSVPVMTTKTEYDDFLHEHKNDPVCTPALFKEYYKNNRHFKSDGTWYAKKDVLKDAVYMPNGCRFSTTATKTSELMKCLTNKRITKVLIHGDSNGKRYFQALLTFLGEKAYECSMVREELTASAKNGLDPYYELPGRPVVQKNSGCSTCLGQTHRCISNISKSEITVEFMGMVQMLDERLQLDKSSTSSFERNSFLEFLFLDYFPHYGHPDIWVMSPPAHHESYKFGADEYKELMDKFAKVIKKHLPDSTHLIILSDRRECIIHQQRRFFYAFKTLSNFSKNVVLHAMNQIIFDSMYDMFRSDTSNVHAFLDMSYVSCPVYCRWHFDGAHMLPEWYDIFIKNIFSFMCAEKVER